MHSLDTKYDRSILSYVNSYRHEVKLDVGHVSFTDQIDFYASPGFTRENEKVLDGLLNDRTEKEIGPSQTTMFLPLIFPNLYAAMAQPYGQKFERLSLKAYHKYAEHMQISFEKSPKDYIRFFNEKGFQFERKEGRLYVGSIYSKYPVQVLLALKTQTYLESSTDFNTILNNQAEILKNIRL